MTAVLHDKNSVPFLFFYLGVSGCGDEDPVSVEPDPQLELTLAGDSAGHGCAPAVRSQQR